MRIRYKEQWEETKEAILLRDKWNNETKKRKPMTLENEEKTTSLRDNQTKRQKMQCNWETKEAMRNNKHWY